MLSIDDVRSRVYEIIADVLNIKMEVIYDDFHFVNDLGADSLDRFDLFAEVQKEFEINIPEEFQSEFKTEFPSNLFRVRHLVFIVFEILSANADGRTPDFTAINLT
jgi:acyl carrier protein